VIESQRWRLLAAAGEVLEANGYAHTKSADIAARAGVSRSTFYEHFEDVDDCLLAACRMAGDCIVDLVSGVCAEAADGHEPLTRAVDAALAFLSEDPTMARLVGSEAAAGVPEIAAAREGLVERLARMLQGVRPSRPGPSSGAQQIELERSLVRGALTLVSEFVAAGEADGLPGLAPELSELLAHRFQPA
jgi:AcrR family transcriptional regulator